MDIVAPREKNRAAGAAPAPTETKQDEVKKGASASISWSAPEYNHIAKSKEWFWAVGILSAAFIVVSMLLKNFLFAIFIAFAGFTVALYGARRPQTVKFAITGSGVRIGEQFYPYESLKFFWINYDPPRKKEIRIVAKKSLMSRLTLPLGETDPNETRKILNRVLKEEEINDSLAEIIANFLGF